MLWTTEEEELYVVKNSRVFETEAGDVLQVIDVKGRRLRNVITLEIEVVSDQRVNFRLTSAILRGKGWRIPLPPFGQGWFESVYLDDDIRVAKDIRGDYLVVDRAPYVWKE
ncbi:putative plastid-lipid-associated protein 11, chloroplastic [Drosera capensis]